MLVNAIPYEIIDPVDFKISVYVIFDGREYQIINNDKRQLQKIQEMCLTRTAGLFRIPGWTAKLVGQNCIDVISYYEYEINR